MSGQKRHFPYYSTVPEIELQKRSFGGVNPGREHAQPRTFIPGNLQPTTAVAGRGEVQLLGKSNVRHKHCLT